MYGEASEWTYIRHVFLSSSFLLAEAELANKYEALIWIRLLGEIFCLHSV